MGWEILAEMGASRTGEATVTHAELMRRLIESVDPKEWDALEDGAVPGGISEHNRAALLRLREFDPLDGELAAADIERMQALLGGYLEEHLPGRPEAARWIVLACLALAFVLREPLHPVKTVGARSRFSDGRETWYCPLHGGVGTTCEFCPCKPLAELERLGREAVERMARDHGPRSAAVKAALLDAGIPDSGVVAVRDIAFHGSVRKICEGNVCGSYGLSWACPPAVGTVDECRDRCSSFDAMQLFSRAYPIEDSFDFEGMAAAMRDFKRSVAESAASLREAAGESLLLSNEGCGLCATCTWPDAPCRFPGKMAHSIEGYGLSVPQLADAAGMRYSNGPNTVTFFGAILYRE